MNINNKHILLGLSAIKLSHLVSDKLPYIIFISIFIGELL